MTLKRQIFFLGGSCYGIAVMIMFVSTTVYCSHKCTAVQKPGVLKGGWGERRETGEGVVGEERERAREEGECKVLGS